jgi:hypothetical protein
MWTSDAHLGLVAGIGRDEDHLIATAGHVQGCVRHAEHPLRLHPLHFT